MSRGLFWVAIIYHRRELGLLVSWDLANAFF